MEDKELILYIFVFALVTVVTYIISHLSFDFSWYVGVGAGAVAMIVGLLFGGGVMGVSVSIVGVLFGTLISAVLVCIFQFFRCTVDYSRKEYTQFEDDDYYYYVKAIPKVVVAPREKSVKKFQPVNDEEDEFEYTETSKAEPEYDDEYDSFIAQQVQVKSGYQEELAKTQVRPVDVLPKENATKIIPDVKPPVIKEDPEDFDELDMDDDF